MDSDLSQDEFYDLIYDFIESPRWITPINSFIDEKCILFDADDENKLEYLKIHSEYK